MDSEVLERLRAIIADRLDVDPDTLTEATSLVDDLEADSLDLADLALAIEDSFSIRIPEADVEQMLTVGGALRYLERRLQSSS